MKYLRQNNEDFEDHVVKIIQMFGKLQHKTVQRELTRIAAFMKLYEKENAKYHIMELQLAETPVVYDPMNVYGQHTSLACHMTQSIDYHLHKMKDLEESGTVPNVVILACRIAILECYTRKLFYFGLSCLNQSGLSIEFLLHLAHYCEVALRCRLEEKDIDDFWYQQYSLCLSAKYAILYHFMGEDFAALRATQKFVRDYQFLTRLPGNLVSAQISLLLALANHYEDPISSKVLKNFITHTEQPYWVHRLVNLDMAKEQDSSSSTESPPVPPRKVARLPSITTLTNEPLTEPASMNQPNEHTPLPGIASVSGTPQNLPSRASRGRQSHQNTAVPGAFQEENRGGYIKTYEISVPVTPTPNVLPDISSIHQGLRQMAPNLESYQSSITRAPIQVPTPTRYNTNSNTIPTPFAKTRDTLPPISQIFFLHQEPSKTPILYPMKTVSNQGSDA